MCMQSQWHPTPALLPGKSHGWRSLVGCSPWGREESDRTERLHFPFSLSCIGEGNGNALQCSRLENPRDGGIWWAAVYGVAQSRTQLKRCSSSSNSSDFSSIFAPGGLGICRVPTVWARARGQAEPGSWIFVLLDARSRLSPTASFLGEGAC